MMILRLCRINVDESISRAKAVLVASSSRAGSHTSLASSQSRWAGKITNLAAVVGVSRAASQALGSDLVSSNRASRNT